MSRLIDADALKIPSTSVDIFENCRNCRLLDEEQVREIIDNAPTIDAVEADLHTDGTLWIKIDHLKGVVAIKNVVLSCSRWCATFIHEEDAVEVVRCKECKWKRKCDDGDDTCGRPIGIMYIVNDDDYCSYGERETE